MANGYVFREYIGAQGTGVRFSDVPVNGGLSFHFILAFAIDYMTSQSSSPTPTNGVFRPYWDTVNLSPAAVAAAKSAHPNLSVMAGLGGDSLGGDANKVFFSPTSVDSWVGNAVSSLTGIINMYGLDGIDIDYEHFADSVAIDTFVECMGRLLTQLKARFPKLTTSIAPFEHPVIQKYYPPLWSKYSGVIDYVNFQFYGYGPNTSVDDYVSFYNDQLAKYPGAKILASFQTGPDDKVVKPDIAIAASKELQRQNKLPGIFIWSADSSKKSTYGFKYEIMAQQIVANH